MNRNMEVKWNELHSNTRFRPKYPSESVVQFIFRNFNRNEKYKILDLGCGTGRHVFFLAQEGFDAYGTDFSFEGIRYTEEILLKNGLSADVRVSSVENIPYDNEYFDGIICYGVLYYCKLQDIQKSINEIFRVLKKDGKAFIYVRSTKDYRYGTGKEIEKNTFLIEEDDSSKHSFNENGMITHFFEKEEIENLFAKFSEVVVDEIIETYQNNKFSDCNYKICVKK